MIIVSIDFHKEIFTAMQSVAEATNGQLSLDEDGRVVITLDTPRAERTAAVITNDDFMWGYVEALDASTLGFRF